MINPWIETAIYSHRFFLFSWKLLKWRSSFIVRSLLLRRLGIFTLNIRNLSYFLSLVNSRRQLFNIRRATRREKLKRWFLILIDIAILLLVFLRCFLVRICYLISEAARFSKKLKWLFFRRYFRLKILKSKNWIDRISLQLNLP